MADRTDLRHLHAMLKMASEIDPFMTVTRLECFLAFASKNDINSVNELRSYLSESGISSSAVSRNISYWMDQSWLRADGSRPAGENFIHHYPDPKDHRVKQMVLTSRGEKFCDDLLGAAYPNGVPE